MIVSYISVKSDRYDEINGRENRGRSRMENPVKQDEDKQIREPQHSTLN
jgi:hypothetical protein